MANDKNLFSHINSHKSSHIVLKLFHAPPLSRLPRIYHPNLGPRLLAVAITHQDFEMIISNILENIAVFVT